jgi:peptidyl-prolyl cis-trans isomerase SurA
MKLYLKILCIIFFSVFFAMSAHCEVVDRIIAIVNDDIITLKELENFVTIKKQNQFTSIDEYLRNIQLKDKLDVFINGLLIKQQARKLRIDVSDKEVMNIIENIKKQNLITDIELKEQLKKDNISYEDYSEGIRLNVLRSRVLTRVISPEVLVTDTILRAYYDQHKDDYVEVEYGLKQIFISGQRRDANQRATEAYKLLTEGKIFEDVAVDFSDDPSAKQGGDIGFAKSADLLPVLKDSVKLLIPNTYTNVVQSPYGFHILKLMEIKKSDLLPFEKVKDKIHERIVLQESEKRSNEYINKLRQSSYIEVKI